MSEWEDHLRWLTEVLDRIDRRLDAGDVLEAADAVIGLLPPAARAQLGPLPAELGPDAVGALARLSRIEERLTARRRQTEQELALVASAAAPPAGAARFVDQSA